MFKCYECEKLFENPKRVSESRGEFWGMPAYEDVYYCPNCGSEAFGEINNDDITDEEYYKGEPDYDEYEEYERWESERY